MVTVKMDTLTIEWATGEKHLVEEKAPEGYLVNWHSARQSRAGRWSAKLVTELPIGRPPRAGVATSDKPVSVKLTADERAAWKAAAEEDGLSLAEWIRARCNGSIARRSK